MEIEVKQLPCISCSFYVHEFYKSIGDCCRYPENAEWDALSGIVMGSIKRFNADGKCPYHTARVDGQGFVKFSTKEDCN